MSSLLRVAGWRHGDGVGGVDSLDDGARGEVAVHRQQRQDGLAVQRGARYDLPVLDLE